MADIVNGQVSGYDKLDSLKTVHNSIMNELKKEIANTKGLLGEENGFYVSSTCKKITTLLEVLENVILPSIEESFATTEKSITQMVDILVKNDYL